MTLEEMFVVFCTKLTQQELDSRTRWIEITQEIYDYYKVVGPRPLIGTYCLERDLGMHTKIYCKFEGNNTR
jgi:tryptophan synthase beta chain